MLSIKKAGSKGGYHEQKVSYVKVFSVFSCRSLLLLPFLQGGCEGAGVGGRAETMNFTLPSTQDRLINYADEYYGKYHLIITFFPAAFTPT